MSKQRSTLSKQHSTLLPQTATMNMFNLFRHCRKDEISFDIVAETGNIVAKNGNDVEATFDTVERIVQLVAFDNVASTLLLVWTGLKLAGRKTRKDAVAVVQPRKHEWYDESHERLWWQRSPDTKQLTQRGEAAVDNLENVNRHGKTTVNPHTKVPDDGWRSDRTYYYRRFGWFGSRVSISISFLGIIFVSISLPDSRLSGLIWLLVSVTFD